MWDKKSQSESFLDSQQIIRQYNSCIQPQSSGVACYSTIAVRLMRQYRNKHDMNTSFSLSKQYLKTKCIMHYNFNSDQVAYAISRSSKFFFSSKDFIFLKHIFLIMRLHLCHFFLPFIPLCPATPLPQVLAPPQFSSMDHTYKFKFFSFSISYTILNLPVYFLCVCFTFLFYQRERNINV